MTVILDPIDLNPVTDHRPLSWKYVALPGGKRLKYMESQSALIIESSNGSLISLPGEEISKDEEGNPVFKKKEEALSMVTL